MRVKMITTTPGSEDGVTVKRFIAGEAYEMEVSLADVFVRIGVASQDAVVDVPVTTPIEELVAVAGKRAPRAKLHITAAATTPVQDIWN